MCLSVEINKTKKKFTLNFSLQSAADRNNSRGIHTLDTMEKSNMSKKGPVKSTRRKDENEEKPVSKIQVNSKWIDFINGNALHHFSFSF